MRDHRRLYLELALSSALAWVVGVAALTALTLYTGTALQRSQSDASLQAHVAAVYGLTWFDKAGRIHTEELIKEEDLLDAGPDIWIVTPEDGVVYSNARSPRPPDLLAIARKVVTSVDDHWASGSDPAPWRLLAIPTFDAKDRPVAAIVAVLDASATTASWRRYATGILAAALGFVLVGIGMSAWLAKRSLAPLEASMAEREQFLAAAAHELRTPVATIRTLVESAEAGDRTPADALARIGRVSVRTGDQVDRLLTWSRLGAARAKPDTVRLDLLVDSCLEDDESFELPPVVVHADPRLLEIAVRNLVENARVHGGGLADITVDERSVTVRDRGPGIPADRWEELLVPFTTGDASRGSGLGLSLVARIADLHGGRISHSDDGIRFELGRPRNRG